VDDDDEPGFRLFHGGLLRGLGRVTRLVRDDRLDIVRQSVALALIAWVPLLGLWGLEWLLTGRFHPPFTQVEVHARWLVSVPLLFAAERIVDERIGVLARYLSESGLVSTARAPELHRLERRVAAWCDSAILEVVLLMIAVSLSAGQVEIGDAPSRWWDSLVTLPLYRFLLLRWLQRWLLWTVLLVGVSRLELDLNGLHPDRVGGLGLLVEPTRAFALVILAIGSAVASVLAMRMRAGVPLGDMMPVMFTYVGLTVGLALLPLVTFAPMLERAKRRTLYHYGVFAQIYVHAFADRWLRGAPGLALGSVDIQSLNDLGGSHNVVREMRIVPFTSRSIAELVAVALFPMLPLYLQSVSIATLATYLVKALF